MVRDTIRVMVNGLPGNMATEVANLVVKRTEDMYLIPWSLTGPETDSTIVEEWSKNGFSLIYPSEREHVFSPVIDSIIFPKTISVDFTQPTAIEGNVDWYIEHGLPFVMGTTGYTPEQKKEMVRRVEGAGLVAVIAPNMAAPIVAFQSVMEKYCPNLLELAGVTIGAGLIELAKGLKHLALLPASTVQLLGAEKALFRHIKTGSRSPKHGIIINHPFVQSAGRELKGKAARMLADKLSLCARLDYFKGEFLAPMMKKELEAKFS